MATQNSFLATTILRLSLIDKTRQLKLPKTGIQMNFHISSHHAQTSHLSTITKSTKSDFDKYEQTTDAWRHHRMMRPFAAFSALNNTSWLTIGDAHGWDASRLTRMGVENVTASDLSGERLEHAKCEGLIEQYRVENAEQLRAADNSYDFVFCKEAFHHFPRPWIGVYEMLRVARFAVLMIEPRDWIIDRGPINLVGPVGNLKAVTRWLKSKLGIPLPKLKPPQLFRLGDKAGYEEVGNYVFSLSSREIEKIALGLNLPAIGLLGINDHFENGLSDHPAKDSDPKFCQLKQSIENAERLSQSGIGGTSYLLTAIFKQMPSEDLITDLEKSGWYIKMLDRNPFLK
jgi:hypothetical protein